MTGGSSGLGLAFVEGLLGEGVEVWATSRDASRLKKRKNLHPIELDLQEAAALETLLRSPPWEDKPALLINNAGYGRFAAWAELGGMDLEAQVRAMLLGPARLCQYFLEKETTPPTAVVNVSSLAVEFPLPCMHGYNLVKAGLSGLSRSLALEYPGGRGRPFVLDFRPGDFRTAFNRSVRRSPDSALQPVWERLETHLENGAHPDRAWKSLRRGLMKGRSGTVRTGTFFQARVAALFAKCAPEAWVSRAHRNYYGL